MPITDLTDLRGELQVLEVLAEDIDQLASRARDCETLSPHLQTLLDLAWYVAEAEIREATGKCSEHSSVGRCGTCDHYEEMKRNREQHLRHAIAGIRGTF